MLQATCPSRCGSLGHLLYTTCGALKGASFLIALSLAAVVDAGACSFFGWVRRLIHSQKEPEMNLANVVLALWLSIR